MKYGLQIRLSVTGPQESMADNVDLVTEELINLEGCNAGLRDSSIGLEVSTGTVEVEMTVETAEAGDAVKLGFTCLRTAIHAAGGGTPDWDEASPEEHVYLYQLQDQGMRPLVAA